MQLSRLDRIFSSISFKSNVNLSFIILYYLFYVFKKECINLHSAEKNIAQPCIEIKSIMKKDIHPEDYRMVVFKDMTNDYSFLGKSCADTKETMKWEDGNEYPLVKLDISHKSHPFFTGVVQFVDTAGRIDKFNNRYGKRKK